MSDRMRWRYGDTNPVIAPVDSATEIEIGDLLWLDTDDAKPASSYAWTTDASTTQSGFQGKFLGIAMQKSRVGDTTPIRVATRGVFEYECVDNTFTIGSYIAPNTSSNLLEDQKLVKLSGSTGAIGRAVRHYSSTTTSVLCDVWSKVVQGGV
ncbi:MAG: hypothetical protein PHE53_02410 [Thermoguttaceae bacterium]|nr:hypothetical protein [Thermoguttaceae bacterium]